MVDGSTTKGLAAGMRHFEVCLIPRHPAPGLRGVVPTSNPFQITGGRRSALGNTALHIGGASPYSLTVPPPVPYFSKR